MDMMITAVTASGMNGGAPIYIATGTELPVASQEAIDSYKEAFMDYETTPACSHGTCPQLIVTYYYSQHARRKNIVHQRIVTFRAEVQDLMEQ